MWSWKQEHEWLQEGHAQAMQEAQKRVDLAFRAFFQRVKEKNGKAGYPRFKPRHRYDSFTYPQEKGNWVATSLLTAVLAPPKLPS